MNNDSAIVLMEKEGEERIEKELFLGKFPIKHINESDRQKEIYLQNIACTYEASVSVIKYQDAIAQISSTISHDGIDNHLVPRLQLMSDLYKEILNAMTEYGVIDNTRTHRVSKPRFFLEVKEQVYVPNGTFEERPEDFTLAYSKLVEQIRGMYGSERIALGRNLFEDDMVVLGIGGGFGINLSKPVRGFVDISISATPEADYSMIGDIHQNLVNLSKQTLGELVKFYKDNTNTQCTFNIDFDGAKTNILPEVPKDIGYLLLC